MEPITTGRRTERGWELELGHKGLGRYIPAAFLAVWLAGWAVGEAFAIAVLVKGVSDWVAQGAPIPSRSGAAALGVAAFLIVWLTLWTLGGVAAMRELLRLLWGGQVVIVGPDQIVVEEKIGPFRSVRRVPRDAVQAVRVMPRGSVVVETSGGGVEVLRSSKEAYREEIARALRRELGIVESQDTSAVQLPAGWAEVITPEGVMAVTHDPANRRRQAAFMGALTLVVSSVALFSMQLGVDGAKRWALAVVFGIAAAAFGAGTLWLARGRHEWQVGGGRLILQRRFGDRVTERFTARGLELSLTTDSDGDEWFSLDALAEPPDPSAPTPLDTTFVMGKPVPERRTGRRIASVMNDASVPRALGRWLAARGDVPFVDRSAQRPKVPSVAEFRTLLAGSGRVGAFLDRMIGPAIERQERKQREGGS